MKQNKQIVAQPKSEQAVLALRVDGASDEEIKEFVGNNKFYRDGDDRFVAYCSNEIGLIAKLGNNDVIIKLDGEVSRILDHNIFESQYDRWEN